MLIRPGFHSWVIMCLVLCTFGWLFVLQARSLQTLRAADAEAGVVKDKQGGDTFVMSASCACAGRPIVGEVEPEVTSSL